MNRSVRGRISSIIAGLTLSACAGATPAPGTSADPPLDDEPASASTDGSGGELKRGVALIEKRDFKGARAVLAKFRAAHPNDAQGAFYLAVADENLGDLPEAKAGYEHALELDPKLREASVNLSALLLDAGDAKGALAVADEGLRNAFRDPELLTNRALALEAVGNPDDAVKAYATALSVSPNNVELAFAYAELLAKTGRREQAIEKLQELSNTNDMKLSQAIANLFGHMKAFNECVAALDRAIKVKRDAELYVRRGVCRHEMDDEAGARADYEAALAVEPTSAPAHYYLGMHFRQAGDKKRATSELQAAAEAGKGTPIGEAAERELSDLKPGVRAGAPRPKAKGQ